MTEISVKDQLNKLVELQKIDGEIYDLKKQLEEKPLIIQGLKEAFEGTKEKLNNLETELKDIQVKRKDLELELQTKEDDIAKNNAQLSQLKTNKEYSAKISEIESIKADKSIIEEKIIVSFDQADQQNKAIDTERANVAEREKKYQGSKKQIEDEVRTIEDRIKVLEFQRQQITPGVDPETLRLYEKVLAHKEGLAIAPVHNSNCGGCFMNVTPQMINAMKMSTDIVICENCSRILYIEDDL